MKNKFLLELSDVKKTYRTKDNKEITVLNSLDLKVSKFEVVSLVGATGVGKTTLLNIIAGFESVDSGNLLIHSDSTIRYLFQKNAVFPWRTVKYNLTFSLEINGITKVTRDRIAKELCQKIGLNPKIFLDKYPKDLSGGENRRLALGMILAQNVDLMLLDEPTSQLDYFTACKIQNILQEIWQEKKMTVMIVTHDIEEAIFLSDRVLILKDGVVGKEINVDLGRPRNDQIRSCTHFNKIKLNILSLFE